MTYKELAKVILNNPTCWDTDVTIFDDYEDEYYPSSGYDFTVGNDVLDDNHLIICF